MPGVIEAMAEAANMGTGQEGIAKLFKAMEAGEVKAADVMERFAAILGERARQGGALELAMKTSSAEQARFNIAVAEMIEIMGGSGLESGFAKVFKSMAQFMEENHELAVGLGQAMDKLGDAFVRTFRGLSNLLDGFEMLANYIGISESGLAGLSVTALLLATRFGRIAAAAGVLFLVLEDISVGLKGGESYTKDFLDFLQDNAWAEIGLKTAAFAVGLGLIASNLMKIAGGIAAVKGVGAAGGMVGGILNVITKHPLIAALVAATIALNVAHSVYASKAEEHLEKVKKSADFPTSTAISHLQEKVTMDNLNRPMFDPYRTPSYNRLPGVNAPMMMVDKISISVDGGGDPQKTADLVLEKIKEYSTNAMKNLPVTE